MKNSSPEYGYYKKDDKLYFYSFHSGRHKLVKNINISNYQELSNYYCRDDKNIFHEGKLIKKNYKQYFDYKKYGYLKTDNELYWFGVLIDSEFYGELKEIQYHYFTDDINLYVNGQKLYFNKKSFVVLNKFYAKDNLNVFSSSNKVLEADSLSFKILSDYSGITNKILLKNILETDDAYSGWAYDKNNIFYCGKIIISNHKSKDYIKMIKHPIVLTKFYVYYFDKIVKGADPLTFQPVLITDLDDTLDIGIKKIKIFTGYYYDNNHFFKLYEDKKNENLDMIYQLTESDSKDIKDLLRIKERINLNSTQLHSLKKLLTK